MRDPLRTIVSDAPTALTALIPTADGLERGLALLSALEPEAALTALEGLRRRRWRGRRARRLGLTFLLDHPALGEWVALHPARVSALLAHLLGPILWALLLAALRDRAGPAELDLLQRRVWPYTRDPARLRRALSPLAALGRPRP